MRRPRTYAAAINDFTEHEHCSPVDEVVHNPRCIEIARQFGKTPEQVSLDINHIYIDSYRCRAPSKVYGYARVSTGGQSLDAQVTALRAAGARMIFKETASGAKKDRAQLGRLIESLSQGDIVMVTRLDRLARSTLDLLNTLDAIGHWGAGFRSLGDTWADTTTPHGRLMLTVLGGLAEFERELIRARTSEGRARAVANGVKLGRKPTLTPHQRREAIRRVKAEKETR